MPLKGRVGRHASDGRQCQNWKADQKTVIDLLNRIPVADGGTGGSLGGRIVAGLASRALYQAILAFEKKHFTGRVKGFVDPGARFWPSSKRSPTNRRPPTASKPANQWDVLTTKSVMGGVSEGLADDQKLSHADAVNIVRSVLSDGTITQRGNRRSPCRRIHGEEPRVALAGAPIQAGNHARHRGRPGKNSRAARRRSNISPPSSSASSCSDPETPYWPGLDRDQVGASLLMRVANPSTIDQNNARLCGPAAVMFGFAADRPAAYAKFAIELFEKGEADFGRNTITPEYLMRHVNPGNNIDQADWMISGACVRRRTGSVSYWNTDQALGGMTTAWELANWLGDAGYVDVREETNVLRDKGEEQSAGSKQAVRGGLSHRPVHRFRHAVHGAPSPRIPVILDRHWVILRSKVQIANGKVSFMTYTYGDAERTVPEDPSTPLSLGVISFRTTTVTSPAGRSRIRPISSVEPRVTG